jgi:hypothetical protein
MLFALFADLAPSSPVLNQYCSETPLKIFFHSAEPLLTLAAVLIEESHACSYFQSLIGSNKTARSLLRGCERMLSTEIEGSAGASPSRT